MKHVRRMISLAVMLTIMLLCAQGITEEYAEIDSGSRIIVSLGDSYSSGEGIPPFYDQDLHVTEKVKSPDWVAHRSTRAWPGLLKLQQVGMMSMHRNENWFFVAASGAKTKDLLGSQEIKYNRGLNGTVIVKGSTKLAPQLDIFKKLRKKGLKADYVTITIGGNDVGFADIIESAVLRPPLANPNKVTDKVNDIWDRFHHMGGVEDCLYNAYHNVAKEAGDQAEIIVVGYPILLSPQGSDFAFDVYEARYLNDQTRRFNAEIKRIVEECAAEGLHIHYVSVEEEFAGHGAYSDHPYIHPVIIKPDDQDLSWRKPSAYSIHPNNSGADAYARCVQAKINELEEIKKREKAKQMAESASQHSNPDTGGTEKTDNNPTPNPKGQDGNNGTGVSSKRRLLFVVNDTNCYKAPNSGEILEPLQVGDYMELERIDGEWCLLLTRFNWQEAWVPKKDVVIVDTAFAEKNSDYWVLYREGFRNDRIEMATFDYAGTGTPTVFWDHSLELKDNENYRNDQKYYYDDGTWILFETGYDKISDWATEVFYTNAYYSYVLY